MSINGSLQKTTFSIGLLLLFLSLLSACKKKEDVVDNSAYNQPENIVVDELPTLYYEGGEYDLAANVSDVAWTLEPASIGWVYSDGGISHLTLKEAGPFTLTGISAQLNDTLLIRETSLAWTLLVAQGDQWEALSEVTVPVGGELRCSLGTKDAGGNVNHLAVDARWIASYEGNKPYQEPASWNGSRFTLYGVRTATPWTLSVVFGVKRVALTVR